jgi:hypothetical protein
MSYFEPTKNIAYNNKIIYDFFKTSINKNEIQSPATNSSMNYFKVPYVNNSSNPNFYYTNNGTTTSYTIKNIYIYGLIHNNVTGITDSNKNIVGELVVELNSTSGKSYACFLLQKTPIYVASITGDVDFLLKLQNNTDVLAMDFTLNSYINNQDSVIQYNSNNSSVFIFTVPININDDSIKSIENYGITTTLFSAKAPTNYSVIQSNNVSLKMDDQIYIDCNPTGESDETIKTYNLPINSELSKEKQEMDYMKTCVNFAIFTILLVVAYFLVPIFYKFMVIDKIIYLVNKGNYDIETDGGNNVLTRIRTIDVFIGLFFLITGSILFTIGMTTNSSSSNYGFLFVLVFYILSASLVINNKTQEPFMTSYYNNLPKTYLYDKGVDRLTNFDDFWLFIGKVLKYTFLTIGPQILVSDIFLFLALFMLMLFGQITSKWFIIFLSIGCLFFLPILVTLLSLINIGVSRSNKISPAP